jgi:hypothetical protein
MHNMKCMQFVFAPISKVLMPANAARAQDISSNVPFLEFHLAPRAASFFFDVLSPSHCTNMAASAAIPWVSQNSAVLCLCQMTMMLYHKRLLFFANPSSPSTGAHSPALQLADTATCRA